MHRLEGRSPLDGRGSRRATSAPRRTAAAAVVAGLLVVLATAAVAHGRPDGRLGDHARASTSGSPDAGRAVFLSSGCGGCHSLTAGGDTPSGPALTPQGLADRARAVGKPKGPFVAEGIVAPNADVVPGYVSGVMRAFTGFSDKQLDDLVSFLIGEPYTRTRVPRIRIPGDPLAACAARAGCRRTVARWARTQRLPDRVLPGARVVAASGCLSCHTYGGVGTPGAAPDLTRQGLRARGRDWIVKRLRCPTCVQPGSRMPSFAVLGRANLDRVAAFLEASRGRS